MLPPAKYTALQAKDFSNNEIDRAYAGAFDARDVQTYSVLATEIISRLSNKSSFILGVFGHTEFPLYNARGHFNQVGAAQESVKDNATKVADNISFGTKGLIAVVVFVGVVVLVVKLK